MSRLGRWAALAATLLAACTGHAPAPPLEAVRLTHGPFEIIAQGRRVGTGAFPNTSGNPFATMEVTAFALRWRNQDVDVPGVGKQFYRVLRLLDAPRPSVLVATTDFHLVSEDGGELRITRYGRPSTNFAVAQWLDSDLGQPGPVLGFGIEKVFPEKGTELSGGRWLRLAAHTVLDVKTLKAYPVEPWVPHQQGRLGFNAGNIVPRAFSPGQTQFVAPAGADYANEQGHKPDALVVVDIPSGRSYALVLDRRRTRYADFDDITGAWVSHYFSWQRQPSGREALVPRADAKPLPWRGRYVDFGDRREYRVLRIDPAFVEVVRSTAIDQLGAKLAPDWMDPNKQDGRTLTVPGCDHVIALSASREHVGVFVPQPKAPPWVRCQETVARLGALVDAQLASGRYDAMIRFD